MCMFVYVCTNTHVTILCDDQRKICVSQFSPFITWVPGSQAYLPTESSHQPGTHFLWVIFSFIEV